MTQSRSAAISTTVALAAPLALGAVMFAATWQRGVVTPRGAIAPPENPVTEEKRLLGKILFYEEQLSTDNTVACATCHWLPAGGAEPAPARHPGHDGIFNTDDDVLGSAGLIAQDENGDYRTHPVFGLEPQVTRRASPTVINAAYAPELFWDSRAQGPMTDPDSGAVLIPSGGALEIQALNPPLDDAEMAHHGRDWAQVTGKLAHARPLALASAVPPDVAAAVLDARTYPELFRRAFGDAQITPARIAMALATYQRTLIADRSPWDDWNAGDDDAMTPAQRRGFEAFLQGGCLQCHVPTHFTNHFSRNIGLRPVEEDMGLAEFTGNPFDAGRFRTPGVRNAGLRVSFMHNGRLGSLEEVVEFYADAEKFPDNLDPAVTDIQLDGQQRADLVEFLATAVTDPRLAAGLPPFDAPDLFRARGHPIENPAVLEGTGRPLPSGATPRVIAVTPPLIGADDFKVGLTGVPRGSIAELHLSWDEPADGMVPPDRVLGPFVADHPDGLDAVATAHWPIPFSPALNGRTLHMQWVVQAPGSAEPARSPAVRATLFCGFGDCATGCLADFDRDLTVGFADLAAFLGAFNQAQPAADLAEPVGVFNFFDLAAYLDAFNRGCP